jgi:photosynthetic reaction center H subunit
MSTAFTESIDLAQVVLYLFWAFFFGLIWWLRKEDRREGYPLEADTSKMVGPTNQLLIPSPKSFLHPDGSTTYAPNFERDERELLATRTSIAQGATSEPIGDPMTSNVGPAAYAQRADVVELTREGHDMIVPMRVATDFSVMAGPDPRGWEVVATDGKVAGTVKDVWVDRADVMVRYLEVELAEQDNMEESEEGAETPTEEGAEAKAPKTQTRLLPITMLRLFGEPKKVKVSAVRAEHFAKVPTLKEPDRITVLEEEKICAFYAGGRLYAEPKRLGPLV